MKDIKIKNVYKIFNENKTNEFSALKNINLYIKGGDIFIIKGVSGSGKSTLLSLLGGLSKPSSGEILVNKENIAKLPDIYASKYRNETLGFIFQSFNLINGLSVIDNVCLPLILEPKLSKKEIQKKAFKALKIANIYHKCTQNISDLSGGEKQRCAIARALVNDPDIVIADEPTANLDRKNSFLFVEMLTVFKKLNKTVIIATHDNIFDNLDIHCNYICMENGEII